LSRRPSQSPPAKPKRATAAIVEKTLRAAIQAVLDAERIVNQAINSSALMHGDPLALRSLFATSAALRAATYTVLEAARVQGVATEAVQAGGTEFDKPNPHHP